MAATAVDKLQAPSKRGGGAGPLPYLLSLPALVVCIGILVPFFTAVWYSLQRYNLAFPYLRGFNWGQNYANLFTDPAFWNTVRVSLEYTVFTVVIELLFGLGIALLLQRRSTLNNIISVSLLLPLMVAPAIAALMWKLMTNPGFGIFSYFMAVRRPAELQVGLVAADRDVHRRPGRYLGLHAVSS